VDETGSYLCSAAGVDTTDVEPPTLCLLGNVTCVHEGSRSLFWPFGNDVFNDFASVITASHDVQSYVVKTGPVY